MAAAFLLPLFDVGVVIPVRKDGNSHAIGDVCGRIDYVQPGGSTLQDRGVYTPADIRAEYLRRAAPEAHRQEVEAGYIRGIAEEAPGVITLNMRAAAVSVNEFIARAYPYRLDPNRRYDRTWSTSASIAAASTGRTDMVRRPCGPRQQPRTWRRRVWGRGPGRRGVRPRPACRIRGSGRASCTPRRRRTRGPSVAANRSPS